VGIAGPPGAGKSTFIEALGLRLVQAGKRVAVISVDPSSLRSGGSILGDKTRMQELSRTPNAFVRACPSGGVLGGIAAHTHSVVLLCQAARYDVVIVETVGLGQSEVEVEQTVDVLTLLLPPASGDDLQGSKKGIIEAADLVVVNKADGELEGPARLTAGDYSNAMHYNRPKLPFWHPPVLLCSARKGLGIDKMWEQVEKFCAALHEHGEFDRRRRIQGRYWMLKQLERQLAERALEDPGVQALASKMEGDLAKGVLGPRMAAERLVDRFVLSIRSKKA
ncbi:ArgK protein, partial [Tribonema minus]